MFRIASPTTPGRSLEAVGEVDRRIDAGHIDAGIDNRRRVRVKSNGRRGKDKDGLE
jgi:hypothetical protein